MGDGPDQISLSSLVQCLGERIQALPPEFSNSARLLVGFSGGLDSTLLLHAAVEFASQNNMSVLAVHVHHGLSPNADAWAQHCRRSALALSVEYIEEQVRIGSELGSIEERARRARYSGFLKHLKHDDLLLLGHHADDQVETVLMRMIKGLDSAMLAGIPEARRLGPAMLLRPFLNIERRALEVLGRGQGLIWVEDESNQDLRFARNDIRHRILPKLRQRKSDIDKLLLSIANHHGCVNKSLSNLYVAMERFVVEIKVSGEGLRVDLISQLSREAQYVLLRQWIQKQGVAQPSDRIFLRIWSEVLPAGPDASPILQWGSTVLRRYQQWLFVGEGKGEDEVSTDFSEVSLELNSDDVTVISGVEFSISDARENLGLGDTQDHALVIPLSSENGVVIKALSALGSRDKLLGKTKKAWCKTLGIAPWVQSRILVIAVQAEVVALVEATTVETTTLKLVASTDASGADQQALNLVIRRRG